MDGKTMVGRKKPEIEAEIKKRYERRIDNWKKEGFDTSELEQVLNTDLKSIKREFDKYRRKVYRLKDIEVELLLFTKKGVDDELARIRQMLRDVNQIDEVEVLLANLKKKVGEGVVAPVQPSKADVEERDALLSKVTAWTFDGYKVEDLRPISDLSELKKKIAATEANIAKAIELKKELQAMSTKGKESEIKHLVDLLKDPVKVAEASSGIVALKKVLAAEAAMVPPPVALGAKGPKVMLYLKLIETFVQKNKEILSIETLRSTQSNLRRQYPKLFYLVIEKDYTITGDLPESDDTLESLKAFLSYLFDFIGTYAGPVKDKEAVISSLGPFLIENKQKIDELGLAGFIPAKFLDILAKKEPAEPPLVPLVAGELHKTIRTTAAIKIFERLFTDLFRKVMEKRSNIIDKSLRMIKEIRVTAPFIESFDVSPTGRTHIEVGKVKVKTLISTLCKTFDFCVDIAGMDIGKDEAAALAKQVCAEVLEPLVPLPDKLEITSFILKGSLSTKIPTGIPGFDAMLAGGLPKDSSIILQAPSGIEKDVFVLQFLIKGLERNEGALVILSNQSPQRFREKMRELGLDTKKFEEEHLLKIIDWYSFRTESIVGVEEDGAVIKSSLDLTNVGIALNKALKASKEIPVRRAVVDIISPASQSFEFEIIYRFAQVTKAKLRNNNYTTIFTVDKDMHDAQTLSSFHQIFDGVIEIMKTREGNRVLSKVGILSMRDTYFDSELRTLESANGQVFIPENEVSKVGEEEKRFYRERLDAWAEAGYQIEPLTAVLDQDLDTIEAAFVEFEKSICGLDQCKKDIGALDTKGFETDVAALKPMLTDVTKVDTLRSSIEALKAKIDESKKKETGKGTVIAGGDGIAVGEVPLKVKPHVRGKPMMDVGGYHDGRGLIDGVGIIEGSEGPVRPAKPVKALVDAKGIINGNGMVNGRGRVNGRGMVNGRGRVNGKGLINGQGMINGRGRVNGRGRGLVNGKGLINGNGLTNGQGLINGKGLTNGKGLVNGRTRVRSLPRPVRKKTNPWIVVLSGVLVVLIIFSAVIVASKYNLLGTKGVYIDGSFDDWKNANLYLDDTGDQTVNSDINIVKFGAQRDSKYLSFFIKVQGRMMGGKGANGLDSLSIFIDGDKSYTTGYHVETLGADYLLRLEGFDGKASSKNFWKFNTSRENLDFNGFSVGLRVSAESDATTMEAQISLADTTIRKDTPISFLLVMQDKAGNKDLSFVFSDKKGALVSSFAFTATGRLTRGQSVELGTLMFAAYGAPATIATISMSLSGTASTADISTMVLAPVSTGSQVTGTLSGGVVTFPVATLVVDKDTSTSYKVRATIGAAAASGDTVGLEWSGPSAVTTDATALTLIDTPYTNLYIDAPTSKVVIDGAFEDWASIEGIMDPADVAANPNIDLREVKYDIDTINVYFYFRVDGKVMMGTNAPKAQIRTSGGGGGIPGPQPELPVLLGGDLAYIFIDNDNNAATGFKIETIGADYLLEITGRDGRIEKSQYLQFNGKANQALWSWTKISKIDAENDATQVECKVVSSAVNIGTQGFMAVVRMTDWEKHTDTLDEVIVGSGGNRSLPKDHPDIIAQGQIDIYGPLHAPEFKDLLVPIIGTVAIVVIIRHRRKKHN